jgi:hypothetical protein
MTDPTPKTRWYRLTPDRLTPDRLVIGLLVMECLLWLSNWLGWPSWHKGYAVLTAVAVLGVAMLLMLVRFAVALVFHWMFQFSIRSLLVLTMAVTLPCSWLAVEMQAAKKQKEAVEMSGGIVFFDYDEDEEDAIQIITKGPEPLAPFWLRSLLGNNFFARAVTVQAFNDPDLEKIKDLPYVRNVLVDCTCVTGTGLRHLSGLEHVKTLYLCQITDDQLEQLKGLTQLRAITLPICDDTHITDAGVEKLRQALPNCKIYR